MTTRDCYQKNIDHAVSIMNELPRYCLDVYGEVSNERQVLLTEIILLVTFDLWA